jgi:hypothetical protein
VDEKRKRILKKDGGLAFGARRRALVRQLLAASAEYSDTTGSPEKQLDAECL